MRDVLLHWVKRFGHWPGLIPRCNPAKGIEPFAITLTKGASFTEISCLSSTRTYCCPVRWRWPLDTELFRPRFEMSRGPRVLACAASPKCPLLLNGISRITATPTWEMQDDHLTCYLHRSSRPHWFINAGKLEVAKDGAIVNSSRNKLRPFPFICANRTLHRTWNRKNQAAGCEQRMSGGAGSLETGCTLTRHSARSTAGRT
jgi:hypothetical protein